MANFIDLTGQVFSQLTVIKLSKTKNNYGRLCWECICICGTYTTVSSNLLRRGDTKSCGCRRNIAFRKIITKHGMQKYPEYKIWQGMKRRCSNINSKCYKNYGGRGVSVCEEWRESFEAFYSYMGMRPSPQHSIDRIDNEKGYAPGNVRWVTRSIQANNTRANHFLSFSGQTLTLSQWSKITGIKDTTICKRIRRGWSTEKSLTTPSKYNGHNNSR